MIAAALVLIVAPFALSFAYACCIEKLFERWERRR